MDKQQALISIIIPVYNAESYLEKALNSVQAQSYTNFEVIMIDDGSVDSSPEICNRYSIEDKRFRVVHQKNQGPSAARNRGLDEVKGEYVTFLDNDDLLHKDFIMILYQLCVNYNCDIALTKSFPFCEESQIPIDQPEENLIMMDNRQLSSQLLDMGWTGLAVTMAKLYKKSLFQNIRFNENRIIADDDSSIYLLFWASEKSVLFTAPLYFYRSKRKGSITHSNYQLSWLSGVDAFKERMEFYYQQEEYILYAKAMRNYCRKMSENYILIKENFPKEKKLMKDMRRKIKKQVAKMFLLKGNSLKQKCSALLFAWIPILWGKVYSKI